MVWLYELQCSVASSPHDSPQTGENREGRLQSRGGVIGLLNARLVPLEELCQEPVLCCSCPLSPVGQATSRTNGASTGLQEAVRLGLGNENSTPPDDDW